MLKTSCHWSDHPALRSGVVRAEFLRARNFEYVRAAKALGVSDWQIMFRHVLPNAMVATLTLLPFAVTGVIGTLASLDYLGFGLPADLPSLGQLTRQAQQNLQAPHLAFVAFFTFAIMLSLLVFIFEGVRDAFDPRKTSSSATPAPRPSSRNGSWNRAAKAPTTATPATSAAAHARPWPLCRSAATGSTLR